MESDIFTLTEARLIPGPPLPLVIEPASEEIDAVAWATAQRRPIRELLLRHGGILFRGFTGRVGRDVPQLHRGGVRRASALYGGDVASA